MKQITTLTLLFFLFLGPSAVLAQVAGRTVVIERPGGEKAVFRGLDMRELSKKLGEFFKSDKDGKLRILNLDNPEKDVIRFLKTGDQVEVTEISSGSAEEMYREYAQGYDRSLLISCQSNLKNLATANEMYSTDWSGNYPQSLEKLTPNYLVEIPSCPTDGHPAYAFEVSDPDADGDTYEIICKGDHSAMGVPANYPRYSWLMGLLLEPSEALAAYERTKAEYERQTQPLPPEEDLPELKAPQRKGKADPDLLMDLELAEGLPGYEEVAELKLMPSTPESISGGKELFVAYCSACHGDQGKGDGPAGGFLEPKPTDLTDPLSYSHGRLELGIFRSIYFGIPGTGAAPWAEHLDPVDEIWPLVHYVRSLQDKDD